MYTFDAKEAKNQCIKWIKEWFDVNGPDCNAIIGISGGKDSSIVAALCVEALGKNRVIGVMMPNGEQSDIGYAEELISSLGIEDVYVNIEPAVTALEKALRLDNIKMTRQASINLPARIRMSTLYAVAQSMNGRVANTCNLSEDWVGYSTRYGDAAGDFSPLGNLTVQEVKAIGTELNLPDMFIEKVPSDGLTGKTDEDNLGFSYEVLDRYIRTSECEDAECKQRIDELHVKNRFKYKSMPVFNFEK